MEDGGENFLDNIKGNTAGVCIGDRALRQRQLSAHVYDLGEAWKQHTQLPFVFAAWVANKPLDSKFLEAFNEANGVGLNQLDQVLEGLDYPYFNLRDYYSKYIQYRLDAPKRQALQLFLGKLKGGV
jgi:chorismate dehydratase